MKTKITKTNFLKCASFAIIMLGFTAVNAQTDAATANILKQGTAVKVVDNKGTIKYFQSNNGITQIVNTTGALTTTTWQLGGTLTDNTYIEAGTNKVFALDGLELVLPTDASATSATVASKHGTAGAAGWTLLVRDEATGATKKLLATDLVTGIRVEHTQATNAAANVPVTVTGLPVLTAGTTAAKLFVFRNGIKLRSATDFTATADTVTIIYSATDLPMYIDDVVEIQYIK
jgi:hypothetical protein